MLCFFIPILYLLLLLQLLLICACSAQLQFQLDGPQPCPTNPIRLKASRYAQFIYSPHDEQRLYPPDTDCQFLIEASSPQHRIHLSVIESELEEPLFTECDDYVSIRDREGNETSHKEVVRWCGQDYPAAVTSASSQILVYFHSDSVIQKRGFNISIVEFELPGCPPEWISSGNSPNCYKQFVLPHILPWFDAQKECNFERANLAVFQAESDYSFIVEQFSQTHSFPWIGYSDANAEGIWEAADRSVPLWPENFPLKQENEIKDCVFLDWNKRDQVAYEVDDCRNRRPFLCRKKKDGTEAPVVLPSGMLRRGFHEFSIDYTVLVAVVILLLLLLVIACLLYQKFKERNNRVINVDLNQRLVQGATVEHGAEMGGSGMTLGGGSKTVQRSAAAVSLAKDKAKAKEREKREQQYQKNSHTTPKPLETQDSSTSFPLQQFNSAAAAMTMERVRGSSEHQMATSESASQSPRIRFSPNQPGLDDENRHETNLEEEDEEREEEEEGDRHNLGYEPDSDEEETARDRQKRRDGAEEGVEIWGEGENAEQELGDERDMSFEEGEKADPSIQNESNDTEEQMFLQQEKLGEFVRRDNNTIEEMPIKPQLEFMREKKHTKEREDVEKATISAEHNFPPREGTLFSTGQQTMASTQSTATRLRTRKFEKPPQPIGPLDAVSAISMDDYWKE